MREEKGTKMRKINMDEKDIAKKIRCVKYREGVKGGREGGRME